MMTFQSFAFADIYSGGRSSGTFNAIYGSPISEYGYTSIYDNARNNWNGITSKVSVGKTTSISGDPDIYSIGNSNHNRSLRANLIL